MTQKTEDRIQQEIVTWYRNNYCLAHHSPRHIIFHVPNQNQQHLVGIGVLAGVSDLVIVRPDCVLWVEVKDHKGTQSPAQREYERQVIVLGYHYILVRSLEDFIAWLASLPKR